MRRAPCTNCPPPAHVNVAPYAFALSAAVWIALLSAPRPSTAGALLLIAAWAVLGLVLQARHRGFVDESPAAWLLIATAAVVAAILGAAL
jgi:hypothetical protein